MLAELSKDIPNDWAVRAIAEVCSEVTSGGTPSRRLPQFFIEGRWPWVKTQELLDRWIDDTEEHITDAAVRSSSAKILPINTILLAMYGATVGQLGLLRRPMACNQACCAMVVDDKCADFRYLFYQLLYHRPQLKSLAVGAAQQNLSGMFIKSFKLGFPPLPEQRAIARILGTLDDKIELNRQMNVTLEAIAQALFKSWFVDFDPVRAKMEGRQPAGMDADTAALFPDGFEGSVLGEVPRGWEVKPLDQIADFLNGLALQKYPPTDDDYLSVIKIAELRRGVTDTSDRASPNIDGKYIVEDGDVLFSWSGSLEAIVWTGGRGALNQHLFKVTSAQYPMWFYYLWIREHLSEFQHIAAGKATTMGHIQRHHLTNALTLIPPEDTLDRMSQIMQPIVEKIVSNNLECRTLTTTRDALLPKLLSGEIRVEGTELALGAVR